MNKKMVIVRIFSLGVASFLLMLIAGCTNFKVEDIPFYAQAVGGHVDMVSKRQSIDRLIKDESTPQELRERLSRVVTIRRFAIDELALPDSGSYRTYVDVGRPYVTWNVIATPPLSLTPKTWCFPVVGCVSYRGYFREQCAFDYAEKLSAEGMDVRVSGATAYSTLGWFADSVVSSMLYGAEYDFAGTIFHELTHERFYISSDAIFNESYATFVEREGVKRWIWQHGTAQMFKSYAERNMRNRQFVQLVMGARKRLEELYASSISEAEKLKKKNHMFSALHADYAKLKASWGGYSGYDRWFAEDLNNAKLALFATYNEYVPAFENLLAEQGGDMKNFHEAVKALSALPKKERDAELQKLSAQVH